MPEPHGDIAVVIPTFNRRRPLAEAIDTVFAQTHHNFELIVVDDGSADDTEAYLGSISDRRLKWHCFESHRGGNAARNHGAAMSDAPILTFLDSDDCYHPHRLADVLTIFARQPDIDVHISSHLSQSGARLVACSNPDAVFAPEALERYVIGYCLFLGGSALSLRRQAFYDVGGFDETMIRMQDRDLLLRVARDRGCATTSAANWTKRRSPDSLSEQPDGQITALLELSRRHPAIEERYPDLFRYLIAREILDPLLNLRFGEARIAFEEARRDPRTSIPMSELLPSYFAGKRQRRRLRAELSDRAEAGAGRRGANQAIP